MQHISPRSVSARISSKFWSTFWVLSASILESNAILCQHLDGWMTKIHSFDAHYHEWSEFKVDNCFDITYRSVTVVACPVGSWTLRVSHKMKLEFILRLYFAKARILYFSEFLIIVEGKREDFYRHRSSKKATKNKQKKWKCRREGLGLFPRGLNKSQYRRHRRHRRWYTGSSVRFGAACQMC